jgi:acyl-CoA synthetase (AMP-forming)/AMP-acid ligase II
MPCLADLLADNALRQPDKPFLITANETLTYANFDRRCVTLARRLAGFGVGAGNPVGLYLPSVPLMAIGFWACQKLGAVPVPLSAMYRETELANAVAITDMAVLLTGPETLDHARAVQARATGLRTVLLSTELDLERRGDPLPATARAPTDIATVFFTSGTTGAPKGVMQTQANQLSTLRDMIASHGSRFGSEVYYCAAPLFSNLGMTVTVNLAMYSGGSVVLAERWNTRGVLDAIRRHRVTIIPGTPAMFAYLVAEYDPARDDLSSLRLCTNGGAPVSGVVAQRFEALSGAKVIQVYGATETSGQNVIEPVIGVRKPGSAGVPVGASRILIKDDVGNLVPPGRVGEVVIAGDCVAAGYWGNAEATAASFTPDGWLSGDLGYVDEDGYLFIVDRRKDIIISGGHNIAPLEVEEILHRHPGVALCAVLGLPDEIMGERPVAVVALHAGAVLTGADLIAFCKRHLSAYKAPKAVYVTDAIPIGAGKVRKRELREQIAAGLLRPVD